MSATTSTAAAPDAEARSLVNQAAYEFESMSIQLQRHARSGLEAEHQFLRGFAVRLEHLASVIMTANDPDEMGKGAADVLARFHGPDYSRTDGRHSTLAA